MFASFGNWWKRRQQGYVRQDDTQEESVMTEVNSYCPPMFQRNAEEESLASKSQYYDQNSPMLPPRPDEESLVSEAATYYPPPIVIPLPSRFARNKRYWNDSSSFQSSLESFDSLVESDWDPDDASQVTSMPIEMTDSAVIDEHILFLHRQARTTQHDERVVRQQTSRTSDRKGFS
jgi:hypothetical protein